MENFKPEFESLGKVNVPDWLQDAKLGFWSVWGPPSVPMNGDWYARGMYIQGTNHYNYHCAHYGHPSEFGYKDICALWKAEKFDPEKLMEKYYKAGARYFVAQLSHHENFFNYDSKLNPMNSVNIGPHKDVCALWKAAADKYNLPFGLSEHLSASFSWWAVNKGCDSYGPYKGIPYDGNDPAYSKFYYNNQEHYRPTESLYDMNFPWYTKNPEFEAYWRDCMFEAIERFKPDMLYSDGSLPFVSSAEDANEFSDHYQCGLDVVAKLYNTSIATHGSNRAIYTLKDHRPEILQVGIRDIERSQLSSIEEKTWQCDTCIGGWYYNAQHSYKRPIHILEILIDVISKNGTLLLNIVLRPDGSLDPEANYILEELSKWFAVCAEGVYATRPWKTSMEGTSMVHTENMAEGRVLWTDEDFRFVKKDNTVYAYIMKQNPNRSVVLRSFNEGESIKNVRLLGYGNVEFVHKFGVLTVQLPENLPTEYLNCIAVELVGAQ